MCLNYVCICVCVCVLVLQLMPEGVRLVIEAVSIMKGVQPKKVAGEKDAAKEAAGEKEAAKEAAGEATEAAEEATTEATTEAANDKTAHPVSQRSSPDAPRPITHPLCILAYLAL